MTYHCIAYDPVNNVYVFIAGSKTRAYRHKAAKPGSASATYPGGP